MSASLADLRLRVKRSFSAYYLELCTPGIADPMAVYEALGLYFAERRRAVGEVLFALEWADDVNHLAGEIEQDLRRRHGAALRECFAKEPVDVRFRECADRVLARDQD